MKHFAWSEDKNNRLKRERNISFEEIVLSIANGKLLDVLEHPNSVKYPNQKMFIIDINDFAYIVPFVEDEETYFLKTIFPSRKATKEYLDKEDLK